MMKKIVAFLLALLMICTLAACNTGDAPTGEINQTPTQQSDETADNPQENAQNTPADTEDQPQENQGEQTESSISFGSTTGSTYENKGLGIGIRLDETWTFATKEQLAQLAGLATDILSEDVAEVLEKANIVYDMQVTAADGATNINVNYENIGALYGTLLSESAYVDLTVKNLESQLEGSTMTLIKAEKQTFTIDGKEFVGMKIHTTMNGIDLYQALLCIKVGNYMSSTTITTPLEDKTADILAKFYAL